MSLNNSVNNIKLKPSELHNKYKNKFEGLLFDDKIEELKQFINQHINWETLTWKIYEDNSFLGEIVRSNNLELIDYCINLPQYQSDISYLSEMSYYIAYGFEKAAGGDNVKVLEYYENLHINLEIDKLGQGSGLNQATLEKENGKEVSRKYLFRNALYNAVDNEYPEGDIIGFVLSKKDKYGAEDCELNISDMITQLDEESLHYNKFDTIRQHLGYEYDTKLFSDIYNIVKNDPRIHPSISFLALEKDIPYNTEIQELLQDDVRTANVFLYKKLEGSIENKNTSSKIKI